MSPANNATSARLTKLLNQLRNCPQAAGMANSLMQMQDSGRLVLTNLGAADGSTSFTGTISIDSTYGITAHNLGHEWWHTVQRDAILSPGQASGAIATGDGGSILGAVAGQLAWAGARVANSTVSLATGTPGFGPLDVAAEAVGQRISSQCGID